MTISYLSVHPRHCLAPLPLAIPEPAPQFSQKQLCLVPRAPCPVSRATSGPRDDSDKNSVFYVALGYKAGHVEGVHSPRTDEPSSSFPLALSTNNRPIGDL